MVICVCRGQRTISEDNRVPGPHRPLYLSPCLSAASLLGAASELPVILLTPPPISQQGHTGCLNSGHQACTASTLPTGPTGSLAPTFCFCVCFEMKSCRFPGWSGLRLLSSSHQYTSAFYSEDHRHTTTPDFRCVPKDA